MQVKRSFEDAAEGGALYVVGTPIGHLQDLSPRAKEILEKADVIAAEDTRHTRKLLDTVRHFQERTGQLPRTQPEVPGTAVDRAASRG